ncbi:hypothetical protein [Aeromicrobium sp.]|uniref:hypothetical protein n=1 Tax=Aeromicrobium sp. TaxID=1871063 RepID=UPI0030BBE2FD
MSNSFATFSFLLGSFAVASWVVLYGRPLVATSRFRYELTTLRDGVENDVFSGRLPDEEPVEFFWVKCNAMLAQPGMISFSSLVAHDVVGTYVKRPPVPHLGSLKVEDRNRMEQYETKLIDAMAGYIANGSRAWALIWLVNRVNRTAQTKPRAATADPVKLAREYNESMESARTRTPNGKLGLAPKLQPVC